MINMKCDLIVFEVKKSEKLEKEDMHTVTLTGLLLLVPGADNPKADHLYKESVPVKLVISEIAQRDLMLLHGIGKKGMEKEMVLQASPQKTIQGFESVTVEHHPA